MAISEQLHHDLAIRGAKINVSVLCPGFVNTRILDAERNRPAAYQNPSAPGDGDGGPNDVELMNRNPDLVFRVGEVLKVKGGDFRIRSLGMKCMVLEGLPGTRIKL